MEQDQIHTIEAFWEFIDEIQKETKKKKYKFYQKIKGFILKKVCWNCIAKQIVNDEEHHQEWKLKLEELEENARYLKRLLNPLKLL